MKILWAPWRRPYLEKGVEIDACILCEKAKEDKDRENLILKRGRYSYVMLNLYPYNTGHLMIAPYRHLDRLTALSEEEVGEMMFLAQMGEEILRKELKPDGLNLGINLGKVAGAGIADHIHLHLVPRWQGDTNFLPVIGDTKVISEHLGATYERLLPHFTGLLMEKQR